MKRRAGPPGFMVRAMQGLIDRRALVNFRTDPEQVQRLLPAGFKPKLAGGKAILGICLIQLSRIRPAPLPAWVGMRSQNAAHRIAVIGPDGRDGVWVPRRDTNSRLGRLGGGRVFPGEHGRATFQVQDDGQQLDIHMRTLDGGVEVGFAGRAATTWPGGSVFKSLAEASEFFELGSMGWSATRSGKRVERVELETDAWQVQAYETHNAHSTWLTDPALFAPGSVEFDCALVMRDIPHQWRAHKPMPCA